jgi:signal transduction histidine kinase/ligand-binding sensor domain-containing protein
VKLIPLFCLCFSTAFGQNTGKSKYSETGQPFIKYFDHRAYNAEAVNWTIVQDQRGVMYFGNGKGILEYDGNTWRKIEVPNTANVRSLAVADDGTIYVCASGDFGYLQADSTGQLKYQSLNSYLDKKHANFGEMWDVAASSSGIFFKTKDKIFKWDRHHIHVIDSVIAYRLYKVKDKIYSRNNGIGLMQIDGNKVKLMPDGGFFASVGVFDMLPFPDKQSDQKDKILVTTNLNGLFIHDGVKFTTFKTDIDSFLIHNQIYNACRTLDGNYAFATQRGGVAIIDPRGHLVRIINEESGLPTNVVYDVYSDRQGGLWLATLYGIVYCEAISPFSVFQNRGALKTMSNAVIRFNGKLYVANELGVLYLSDEKSTFELLQGSIKSAFNFFNAGGVLLAVTNWGIAIVEKNKLSEFLIDNTANEVIASRVFPGRYYAGYRDGWAVFQKQKNNQFRVAFRKDTDNEVMSIVEEKDGNLWMKGYLNRILHVTGNLEDLAKGSDGNINYTFYDKENGLPGNEWSIYDIRDKMLLTTDRGVFQFDRDSGNFKPDSTLGKNLSNPPTTLSLIAKGRDDHLWIIAEKNGMIDLGKAILQKDGSYDWHPNPAFRRLELSTAVLIYSDYDGASDNEILWISTNEALIRYDPNRAVNIENDYQTLIRKVTLQNDSIIYSGSPGWKQNNSKTILPFDKNDIGFEFSAVTFDKPEATQYQYYLEGNDEDWSGWTSASKKEYTNLTAGDYKFQVRSRNVYGVNGHGDVFYFTVLSPWYSSRWASFIYILLIFSGIFFIDRVQRRRVIDKEQEKSKLREAELIRKQAEELETVDKLVRGINKAGDLESLFNSLLEQTISFIPNAEKASIFLYDQEKDQFRVAYTSGYKIDDLSQIVFSPEELRSRYMSPSDEIEKGIYIVSRMHTLPGDKKLSVVKKPKSMLVMAVEWENRLEAYVVFDNFSDKNAFDPSSARILNRFREHAVSAISKAQVIKALQEKNDEIIRTQQKLVTQEKLASLGTLTAGIAHEIKNPLNFVNNFAEVNLELLEEIKTELDKNNEAEVRELIEDLKRNLEKINEHGNRADSIVKGMLLHSRGAAGEKISTDINELLDQYVALAYHGFRAQDREFNITIEKKYDRSIEKIKIVPQDISRVFLNIINNACYATNEKRKKMSYGFSPVLKVSTKNQNGKVEIRIKDNGDGIPASIREQIFNPFFTTKPVGEGTGLGLSLSYDIITKVHGGELIMESEEGEFTELVIQLPKT